MVGAVLVGRDLGDVSVIDLVEATSLLRQRCVRILGKVFIYCQPRRAAPDDLRMN